MPLKDVLQTPRGKIFAGTGLALVVVALVAGVAWPIQSARANEFRVYTNRVTATDGNLQGQFEYHVRIREGHEYYVEMDLANTEVGSTAIVSAVVTLSTPSTVIDQEGVVSSTSSTGRATKTILAEYAYRFVAPVTVDLNITVAYDRIDDLKVDVYEDVGNRLLGARLSMYGCFAALLMGGFLLLLAVVARDPSYARFRLEKTLPEGTPRKHSARKRRYDALFHEYYAEDTDVEALQGDPRTNVVTDRTDEVYAALRDAGLEVTVDEEGGTGVHVSGPPPTETPDQERLELVRLARGLVNRYKNHLDIILAAGILFVACLAVGLLLVAVHWTWLVVLGLTGASLLIPALVLYMRWDATLADVRIVAGLPRDFGKRAAPETPPEQPARPRREAPARSPASKTGKAPARETKKTPASGTKKVPTSEATKKAASGPADTLSKEDLREEGRLFREFTDVVAGHPRMSYDQLCAILDLTANALDYYLRQWIPRVPFEITGDQVTVPDVAAFKVAVEKVLPDYRLP